ncbi:hypothetical protein EPUS_06685 [Endocarpon pusillum Z07020]|uniref:Pre-mRNA-splicing factor n=1 Tax=Endocarpon pusillum (strain Z07020 / HMAS-L-300199) TaxID=1263415 RepID=U1GAF1_ENDPU|nr:uncharacterized protein EPUS_06685 [Endocarpon pusillum Z07020]ERF68998.1 hypothetical protein EPUS_06685 [Endocarpon pusillum Z07020]
MSKPISISFGKPKVKVSASASTPTPSGTHTTAPAPKRPAFTADPEDDVEDERPPAHESVLGFAADGGAILSLPVKATAERVIENKGNADWRTRGRPAAASTKGGEQRGSDDDGKRGSEQESWPKLDRTPRTADEAALSALLNGDASSPSSSSNLIIEPQPQNHNPATVASSSAADETLSFLADVASRPDPASLADYAALPVEEFGMALLRGMGKKRRANGEVIVIKNPNKPDDGAGDERRNREAGKMKTRDPNAGYLGIGAKAVKIGSASADGKGGRGAGEDDGLGAWGKADMRRNKKGEGLYTPVMLRDRRTGELISERELEERKKATIVMMEADAAKRRAELGNTGEDDWRHRRDRNLLRHPARQQQHHPEGRNGDYREKTNGSSPPSTKMIEYRDEESRRSSSAGSRRRRRSRSRESYRDSKRERDRDRDRDGYHDSKYAERDREEDKYRERDRSRRDRRRDEEQQQQQRYDSTSSSLARKGAHGRDRYEDDDDRGRGSRVASERRRERY